jgi:hypothetical protein
LRWQSYRAWIRAAGFVSPRNSTSSSDSGSAAREDEAADDEAADDDAAALDATPAVEVAAAIIEERVNLSALGVEEVSVTDRRSDLTGDTPIESFSSLGWILISVIVVCVGIACCLLVKLGARRRQRPDLTRMESDALYLTHKSDAPVRNESGQAVYASKI